MRSDYCFEGFIAGCVLTGLLWLVTPNTSATSTAYLKAAEVCAVNGGVKSFASYLGSAKVVCNNSASFGVSGYD